MWKVTAKGQNEAEILLYDVIGDSFWGYQSAKDLIGEVRALGDIKDISLRINSVGGDVFEAQAMYSYLKMHPAKVTVRVDGLAASAASLVAMAGDTIIMPSNALMMIHNPATVAVGDAEEMRDAADVLDKIRDTIANVYMAKTGLDYEGIIRMMDEETWMSATEAREIGFCDEVDDAVEIAAMVLQGGGVLCKAALGSAGLTPSMAAKLPLGFRAHLPTVKENAAKREGRMTVTNVADLERDFPALVSKIKNTADEAAFQRGVQEERDRLKALDALAAPGCEAILAKAKYEEPKDARDVAIELLQAQRSTAAFEARHQDAAAIDPALEPQTTPSAREKEEAAIDAISKNINAMRGYSR